MNPIDAMYVEKNCQYVNFVHSYIHKVQFDRSKDRLNLENPSKGECYSLENYTKMLIVTGLEQIVISGKSSDTR